MPALVGCAAGRVELPKLEMGKNGRSRFGEEFQTLVWGTFKVVLTSEHPSGDVEKASGVHRRVREEMI